ncbi:MAG: hypothetical protein Q7U82_08915 [Gammaproteobacteria bacterium]|nr:hypothetical protein [Gammaproteobacteria bacterium]
MQNVDVGVAVKDSFVLGAALVNAQRACCIEMELCMKLTDDAEKLDRAFWYMFLNEWHLARRWVCRLVSRLWTRNRTNNLYPEFQLARDFFERYAIEAMIVGAAALEYDGTPVGMVYNPW